MNKKRHKGIEGKARTLLNMLSDPGVIIDQHGIFLVVNDAFEKTTGLNPKELVGKPFLDLGITDAETKALLFENLGKVLRGIPVVPYEVQFVSGTGEKRFVEVKGKRITYVGQPADLVVFHDVTQRKENARKLREYAEKMEALVEKKIGEIKESEKKLRSITNSAFDAVFLFDEDDVIVYWNPAAEKSSGTHRKR